MIFDSHTHLNNENYNKVTRQVVIDAIESSEISYVMDVGFNLESSALAAKHAEKYRWCYGAVGCHPHDTKDMDDMQLAMIKGLSKKEKVKAIGEIGLDYYHNHSEKDVQQIWFRKQIQLANELKMPIIIHDRDANEDVMTILKEEGAFTEERCSWFPSRHSHEEGKLGKDARVLLHCYSGSKELAEQYVKLGATISIAGPVTYKNARKSIGVVAAIPIEYILVETDAPYLTPEPFRGKPNMSPYIEHTIRKIAELKGMSYEKVAAATCQNAKIFFNVE